MHKQYQRGLLQRHGQLQVQGLPVRAPSPQMGQAAFAVPSEGPGIFH